MKRYRIYVEDCGIRNVLSIVSAYVESATIYKATGLWRRGTEETLVIEVIDNGDLENIFTSMVDLAEELKTAFNQDAVLLTEDELSSVAVI